MKVRTLGILLGITLVLVALTAIVLRPGPAGPGAGALAPALAERINDATTLRVRSGEREVYLRRGGEGWVVENRGGYPARFDKVRETLVALADAKLVEARTSRRERFGELWLEDPDAPEAKGVLVDVGDEGGGTIAAVVVGKPANTPTGEQQGTFVRRAGEEQTYVSDLKARVDPTITEWISRDVLALERSRVSGAAVARADGDGPRVRRDTPTRADFTVENMPAGRELRYATAGAEPVNAVEYVTLADVARAESIDIEGNLVATITYTCFDGLVITVRLAKVGEKHWAAFGAAADLSLRPAEPGEGEPEPAYRPVKSAEEVEAEAAELNARLGGWAFALDEFKARQFDKRLEDILKEAPGAPAPAPEGPAPEPIEEPPMPRGDGGDGGEGGEGGDGGVGGDGGMPTDGGA